VTEQRAGAAYPTNHPAVRKAYGRRPVCAQSWFLTLRVQRAVDEQQPVMICADGKLLGSRTDMRAISSRHGADPKDVVVHSLKHAALSALGGAGASSVDIATAGGHKTIESSVPYWHPNMDQGRRNSEIANVGWSEVTCRSW
jgi:hypothetical protein